MDNKKEEKVKKNDGDSASKKTKEILDDKKLYDLYRHTTKLIE